MPTTEKQYLKNLSKEVVNSLKLEHLSLPFSLEKNVRVRNVNSDGWAVTLGRFRGYGCSIEVWLDRFTSHERRKLYYVVFSESQQKITQVVTFSKPQLGQHISIKLSDWTNNQDIPQLKIPLKKIQFGKPVFEQYPENKEFFYGIYVYERTGLQQDATRRLVSRIVEFIYTINEELAKDKAKQGLDDYKAVENRKLVQIHLLRERRSHLTILRKQKDNYICQICRFDYVKKYGKLGERFAEAHHIIPLAKNDKKRLTTIDDLITVCADCHRMLHRMNGEDDDIMRLREIVKKITRLRYKGKK
jgi:hypothetical protein